ncbi:MAG: hypothetical protein LLF89_02765 [Spirochaetaceae bacterium]|nr:hypothetical protein [Spirochaetaceae bacterium]
MTLEELSHLDYEGAQKLLMAYATDIKRHEKDIEALDADISLWNSRVRLAADKGMAELSVQAQAQCDSLKAKRDEIAASKVQLDRDMQKISEVLPELKAKRRSIDPDALQAELSMMTGEALEPEKAKAEQEIRGLEQQAGADDALTALKKKMGLGGNA